MASVSACAESQMDPCMFPSLRDTDTRAPPSEKTRYQSHVQTLVLPDAFQQIAALSSNIDLNCLCQYAFALLLKSYVGTNDVAFGVIHGATAGVEGKEMETTIETHFDEAATILENLQRLSSTPRASGGNKQFNTILCFTRHDCLPRQFMPTYLDSGIMLVLQIVQNESANANSKALRVRLLFHNGHCDQWGAQNVLATFESILAAVTANIHSGDPLAKLNLISARDREQITAWNVPIPPPVKRTLNECFEKVFQECADKQAVYTSTGSFTYRQLDNLSTTLALHLVDLGLVPNMVVPICMDKSRWSTCAMTAVWKAGGALTALEPEHPDERALSIVAELEAKIVICDTIYAPRFQARGIIVLSDVEALIATLGRGQVTLGTYNPWHLSNVAPHDLAFVVFTSGSTGKPKGILNTHNRLTTEHQWYREVLGYRRDARSLQFASYAYIPGTADNYRTLLHGATLCVPSKFERISDLVGFIRQSGATRATLTPTILQTINPEDIPSVRDLVASGEPVSRDLEALWSKGRRFISVYGSTEGGSWIKETCNSISQTKGSRPASGDQWLIDPHNVNRLVPVGAAGEIVLESHETATEYLNDQVATARAFLKSPAWADERNIAAGCRYLRLGDLGRYESDGSITVYGRADTQVKIYGQRVDLQDIESNLRALLPTGSEAVVDIVKPVDAPNRPVLTAFCRIAPTSKHDSDTTLRALTSRMSKALPRHMIPKAFIAVDHLPRNFSQKIDRKKLRSTAESMSYKDLVQHMPRCAARSNEDLKTDKERVLAQLWAMVLRLEPEKIKRGDNFLALGGDSLCAMRLVPLARSRGLKLSALDILTSPVLGDMAQLSISSNNDAKTCDSSSDTIGRELAVVSLQATDFQEWAIFAGADSGGYIDHFMYDFSGHLDVDRLRNSCQRLVAQHPVLGAIFTLQKQRVFMQMPNEVGITFDVHHDSTCEIESRTQEICARDRIRPFGVPIIRFDLVTTSATQHRLIIRLSHAQYDGFSAKSIGQHLRLLYLSQPLPPTLPFHDYVQKIQEPSRIQLAEAFWKARLQGSRMPRLVERRRAGLPFIHTVDGEIHRSIEIPSLQHHGINSAGIVKTAWALTISALSGCTDVVFGDLISGRQVAIPGIETVFGPCLNFTPVRVKLGQDLTNLELLQSVQDHLFRAIPHESLGMKHIIDKCTGWGLDARYSSIVNFINFETSTTTTRWDNKHDDNQLQVIHTYDDKQFDTTDLWLKCRGRNEGSALDASQNSFDLFFRYSRSVYQTTAVEKIADIYCSAMITLATALEARVMTPYVSAEELEGLVPSIDTSVEV